MYVIINHPIIAFSLFLALYFYTTLTDRYSRASYSLYNCVIRVIGKNLKALVWLVFGVILFILAIINFGNPNKTEHIPLPDGGGPESEKFAKFTNFVTFPLQVVAGFLTFAFQIIIVAAVLGLAAFKDIYVHNTIICNVLVVVVYLGWLVLTTISVVESECPLMPSEVKFERVGQTITIFLAMSGIALLATWDYIHPAFNYLVFHTPLPS